MCFVDLGLRTQERQESHSSHFTSVSTVLSIKIFTVFCLVVFVYWFVWEGGCGFACLLFNGNALMHCLKSHCASCGAYRTDIFLSLAGGDWQAWKKGMNKGAVSEIHLIFNSSCQTVMQTRVQEKLVNVEI